MTPHSVLIIGISGSLAQRAMEILNVNYPGIKIWGVDGRACPPLRESKNFKMHRMPYTRGNFERLFRDHHFDLVLNLGRLSHSHASAPGEMARKLEFSVIGNQRILDLSLKNGVKKVVTLSTFHVYGALPDNSAYITEEMPLRASLKYSDLRHVVDMDNVVSNWMWRHQNDIESILLRPCNIIGPGIRNTISQYLASQRAPYPMDFNPMMQFIHEFDMANVVAHACERLPTGIYNVAPEGVVDLRKALKMAGHQSIAVPFSLGKLLARMVKLPTLRIPNYLIDYLMYSCLIDSSLLRKHFPHNFFRFPMDDALQTLKR